MEWRQGGLPVHWQHAMRNENTHLLWVPRDTTMRTICDVVSGSAFLRAFVKRNWKYYIIPYHHWFSPVCRVLHIQKYPRSRTFNASNTSAYGLWIEISSFNRPSSNTTTEPSRTSLSPFRNLLQLLRNWVDTWPHSASKREPCAHALRRTAITITVGMWSNHTDREVPTLHW